jgi:hypothetical protein
MGGVDNGSMESIIVLGADRVGKTTAIRNTREGLERDGYTVTLCHFGGVSPKDHSPVQQFVDTLSTIGNTVDYLILDRFVSDTLFYESYRYQLPPIPNYVAAEAESMLLEMSSGVRVVLIEHNWDGAMEDRHEQEIRSMWPGCTGYWLRNQIEKRRLEHEAYYEHTNRYLASTTLIRPGHIHRLPGHLVGPNPVLEMASGMELKAIHR